MSSGDDISTQKTTLAKAVAAFVLLIPVVWWAATTTTQLNLVVSQLEEVSEGVQEAAKMRTDVEAHTRDIERLRSELETYKVWVQTTRISLAEQGFTTAEP